MTWAVCPNLKLDKNLNHKPTPCCSWDLAQESLRLYPPVPVVVREATEDMVVCGHAVLRGSWLHVRDPAV